MTLTVFGISQCDTVKKARAWLAEHDIPHVFHDYKKQGADPARLSQWAGAAGWEALLNRAGTTFRKLPEADREGLDEAKAIALMAANPSCMRRPVVERDGALVLVGFMVADWERVLKG